jgi:hypothetical protein
MNYFPMQKSAYFGSLSFEKRKMKTEYKTKKTGFLRKCCEIGLNSKVR